MAETESTQGTEKATHFELMVAFKPELRDSEIKKKLKEIEELIESGEGKVTVSDYWGKRELAYRIKGNDEALFNVFNFTIPNHFIKELNENLRIEKDLLRYLVIKLPDGYEYTQYDLDAKVENPRKDSRGGMRKPRHSESNTSVKHAPVPKADKPKEEVKDKNVEADKKELDDKLGQIIGGDDLNL